MRDDPKDQTMTMRETTKPVAGDLPTCPDCDGRGTDGETFPLTCLRCAGTGDDLTRVPAPPDANPDGSCSDPARHQAIADAAPAYLGACACMGPLPICRCSMRGILECRVCGGEHPDPEERAKDYRYDVPRDWTPVDVVAEARRVRATLADPKETR